MVLGMNKLEKLGFTCKKNNKHKIVYKKKGYKTIVIYKKTKKLVVKSKIIIINGYNLCNLTPLEMEAVEELTEGEGLIWIKK